uniref:Uncharacterized protein n=2 Tax=Aegilops tauschii subsp. strangulata TaxID=200361 RepID=A0A453RT76_AEGTS
MCEGISHSHAGMLHFSASRCRASTGRGDEPRRAKLRTPAGAAPVQRRGLQRQQHLCVGRNSTWARAGGSSPPTVGGSRAPARHHQGPAAEHQLASTSGRQQSTTWARAGQEGPLGVGEEERLGRGGGGGRRRRRRWKAGMEAEVEDAEEEDGLIQSLNWGHKGPFAHFHLVGTYSPATYISERREYFISSLHQHISKIYGQKTPLPASQQTPEDPNCTCQ